MRGLHRPAAILAALIAIATGAHAKTHRGVVLAEDGTPAKGARVWAARLWHSPLTRVETNADDQGRFAVDLGPGQWALQASLGDQCLDDIGVIIEEGKPSRPPILRLSTQGHLKARLTEAETGKPLAGGRLVLDNGLEPVADADGRIDLGGVSRARYHEAFVVAPGRERKRILFEMSERPVTELELAIPGGAKAVGHVLDRDGHPIPGANVGRSTSGSAFSGTGLWVQADDQGRFVYDGLPLERATWLNAGADGFQGDERWSIHAEPDGRPLAIDFRLSPNPAKPPAAPAGLIAKSAVGKAVPDKASGRRNVSGVVVDPAKKPVAGVRVRWGAAQSNETVETKTEADGSFSLKQVPAAPETICVIPESGRLAPGVTPITKEGDQQVQIELAAGRSARGVVADDRGTPFAGVSVLPIVSGTGRYNLALWERSTKTDREGRFVVDGLPAEGVTFTFLRSGVSDLRDHPLTLDSDNAVVMWSAGAIRGKVVDHEGKPVRSFRVLLNGSRQRRDDDKNGGFFAGFCGIGLSYTSDDGSFLVRNLTGGSVTRVTVLAPGHGEATIDRVLAEPMSHQPPAQATLFRLPPANTLKVLVIGEASGKPIPDARIGLILDDLAVDRSFSWGYHDTAWGDSVHARSDGQGIALFDPLSFAEATVIVQAPGFARRHIGWRDHAREIIVKLARECVVAGQVVDAKTGKPLDGLSVQLQSPSDGMNTTVRPGGDGRFRLAEVPAGKYNLSIASGWNGDLLNQPLELKPGQPFEQTFRVTTEAK